jgi:glucuronosyltransferase
MSSEEGNLLEYTSQDLQRYLDESTDGVIYFSMGSNLHSSNMKNATINSLLQAFSRVKERVLWKWETDSLPGKPSNVKLGKWLPQSDILGELPRPPLN